jgi:protocatechuate 3,4-dioxygenase beta subunit
MTLAAALLAPLPARAAVPTVEGTVSAPGGVPAADALVVVYPGILGRGEEPVTARTDARGRFRVTVASTGEYSFAVDARGFAPTSSIRARTGASVAVTLEEGLTLHGTVRDARNGKPIAGARVRARGSAFFATADPRVGQREATTDGNGRYRLEQLPAEAGAIYAVAKGYASASATVSPTAEVADVLLGPGVWLSGTVRSPGGDGLEGTVVTAIAVHSPGTVGGYGQETTGPGGRFEIVGLERGVFHVAAYHAGFAPAFAPPVRVDGPATLDLTLRDAASVVGRLIDADGHPVRGTISVEQIEGGFPLPRDAPRAVGGPDGRFRLRDLPPGTHRAGISARGYADKSIPVQAREGAETDVGDVTLATGSVVRGRLRDAKGSPVPGARIHADPAGHHGAFAMDVTDIDGAFLLAGLGEGRYRLSATVGAAHRGGLEVEAGGEPVEWILAPAGAIVGEVVDASGRPVDSFHVTARPVGGDATSPFAPRSTASGAFRIEDVVPGRYALLVTSSEHADEVVSDVDVTADRTTDVGRIRLGPAGIVRGTVVDAAGRPVAGAAVMVRSQRDYEHGYLSHGQPQAHSSPEGSFEVRGLNPGRIRIEAHHPRLGGGQADGLEVDPAAGATVTQVVLEPGGRLRGSIRRRGQGLAASVTAMAFPSLSRDASTVADDEGRFVLDNLPAGEVWIEFKPLREADGRGLSERRVWIRDGETVVLDVDLRDILVGGRVTPAGGSAEGLRVAFDTEGRRTSWPLNEGASGPQHMVSRVGPDGAYALRVAEPGPYTARVETADGVVLHRRRVTVADADEHRLDLEFTSTSVSGTLVDEATERPIPNGTITAIAADDPDRQAEVLTGAGGLFELHLEPGTYVLQAQAPGYAGTRRPLAVGLLAGDQQRVALPRGWSLRGRVVDARGQAVSTVQVFARAEQNEEAMAHANTRPDGSFELTGLTEARYNLFAGSDMAGFATLAAVSPETGEPVLTLRSPGRVRVTVKDASGAPIPGALMVISAVEGAAVFGLSSFFAMTDAAGVVEMSVPLGTIEVSANKNGRPPGAATVEVRPGELAHVTISMPEEGPPEEGPP